MAKSEEQAISFEEAMGKLEKIVERLEDGEVPLEESIALYKEGMELSKWCHDKLKKAEDQLTLIMKEDEFQPFKIDEEE